MNIFGFHICHEELRPLLAVLPAAALMASNVRRWIVTRL
jgi:hypothetical protein